MPTPARRSILFVLAAPLLWACAATPAEPASHLTDVTAAGWEPTTLEEAMDLLERRDEQRALDLAGSLLSRGGEGDFEVHYTLGLASSRLGYEAQARLHLRAALDVEPTNPFALAAFAELEGLDG